MNLVACPKSYQSWYDGVFPKLLGHGLWLRGGEINTLSFSEYHERKFRVLFTRLSTYFDTGYSFTHQILYQIAAGTSGVYPDLAYLPPKSDLKYFSKGEVPWFLGTQTKFGPDGFDLIGISNSIVQELINLRPFLESSKIPLRKSERMTREDLPIILLGGANALYSTLIWNDDPMVDAIFVGESDHSIRQILEICRDGKARGLSKKMILHALEKIDGFFQPESSKKGRKSFIPNLNQSEALYKAPVYFIEDQIGTSHLQISEGCPAFCSFCAESWDRKPYRERNSEVLRENALRLKAGMGLDKIDLYSFNFNMHSGFYDILWELAPLFKNIGLKSQRFDLLSHDPEMIEFQHALEKASITCGLEGISPRLRKYLHKNLEKEDLHRSLEAIFKSKARELKVFLIATGKEEDQDFDALVDMLEHFKKIKFRTQAQTRVIFSMTPLVRFPWTPLEFEDGYSIEHMKKIIDKAATKIQSSGFEFRESADLSEYWTSQVIVRADDERIYKAIQKAARLTEFVYYREFSDEFRVLFEKTLSEEGLNSTDLIKGFDFETSQKKPWTKIETGVHREFLWEEVIRARSFMELDYCLGKNWKASNCFHCGGCTSRYHVRDIVLSSQKRKYNLNDFKTRITKRREDVKDILFFVNVHQKGPFRKIFATALAQALMESEFALTKAFSGFKENYWSDPAARWLLGCDLIQLQFSSEGFELLQALVKDSGFIKNVNSKLAHWGEWNGCEFNYNLTQQSLAFDGSLIFETEFEFKPDSYLREMGLKYTLRKTANGYQYDLIPQSLKKGILIKLNIDLGSNKKITIVPGAKFELGTFIKKTFRCHSPEEWVRIQMKATGNWKVLQKPELKFMHSQSSVSVCP